LGNHNQVPARRARFQLRTVGLGKDLLIPTNLHLNIYYFYINHSIFNKSARHIAKRVDARHRRPAAVPRDLARASPALFAQKVLTHHKHLRKSAPPLRKPPTAQKALRALRPWLGHAGSTKFGRPQKTQAFFGAPELRPRAGVMRKVRRPGDRPHSKPSPLAAARAVARTVAKKITKILTKTQQSNKMIMFY